MSRHSSAEGVQALGLCNQQWTSGFDCWYDALPGSHLRKNLHIEQMDASERQHWQVRNEEAKYCSFIWNFIFTLNEDSDTQLSKRHVAFRHHNACGENVTLTANIFYEWQHNKTARILWWCINRDFVKTAKAQSICLLHSSPVSDIRGWCYNFGAFLKSSLIFAKFAFLKTIRIETIYLLSLLN